MKLWLPVGLLLAVGIAGCVTQSQADAQARMAFLEGQNQALMRMQGGTAPAQTPVGPGVTLIGPVQNLAVPWRVGLTLTQAIVSAHYTGNDDPSAIVIHRNGQDIPINPKGLLKGEDFVLQVGDVIEIQP